VRAFASPPVRELAPTEGALTRTPTRPDHVSLSGSSHRFSDIAVAPRGGAGNPEEAPTPAEAPAPAEATKPASAPAPEIPDTASGTAIPTAPTQAASPESEAAAPSAAPALSWTFVKTHTWDALWFFCGEHPAGFSTRVLLRAEAYGDPTALRWSIVRGADKIDFSGAPTGPEVHVTSKAGSSRLDDITVRVTEGRTAGAPSHDGTLTVRKPHRLIHRFTRHHANSPAFDSSCSAGGSGHWTEVGYRVVDNVGGTIVGATVNEDFPSAPVTDQPNNWWVPNATPATSVWHNTDGTFIDYWWVCDTATTPLNPTALNPGDPHDGDSVDRTAHEFYVGRNVPGRGCRVQRHTAHRYLGHTEHENVVTPAP
jgi:hypothetical protein